MHLTSLLATGMISGTYGFCIDSLTQHAEITFQKRKLKKKQLERAQLLEPERNAEAEKEETVTQQYDLVRAKRFGTVAFLWVGPWMHIRFTIVDHLINSSSPSAAFLKMIMNLYMFGPITTSVGIGLNEWLKPNSDFEHVKQRLKSEFWKIQSLKWCSRPFTLWLVMLIPGVWQKQVAAWILDAAVVMFTSWRINAKIEDPSQKQVEAKGATSVPSTPKSLPETVHRVPPPQELAAA